MSLVAVKTIAAAAIFAVAFAGGAIPIQASKQRAGRRFLSLGNALAGGIFLGAGFIHLLPEASEALEEITDYPLAALLVALGVGLLLLVDRVVLESRLSVPGEPETKRKPVYPYVLLVVLSVHSVIAGIALGLQPEIAASLLVMFGILFHKGSAAFALMVTVQSSGNRQLWPILTIFSLMTPAGIALGTVASGLLEGRSATLFEGSFNALAAGTFVYVAVLDVLDAEMSRINDRIAHYVRSALIGQDDVPMPRPDRDRPLKFLLVLAGIGSMAVLALWM